jgi:hypothetical protein
MVLVAAVGVAFVLIRVYLDHLDGRHLALTPPREFSLTAYWRYATFVVRVLAPLATSLSLALWMLRLRQPRPRWRRLIRQPGMLASTATVLGTVLFLVKVLLNELFVHWDPAGMRQFEALWLVRLPLSAEIVAVTWILLISSGLWLFEPSWIDRAGTALGVYWIISATFFDLVIRY